MLSFPKEDLLFKISMPLHWFKAIQSDEVNGHPKATQVSSDDVPLRLGVPAAILSA